MTLQEIISKLKEAFKREEVKKAVLKPEWQKRNKELEIDSVGFCYAASNVIYALNGKRKVWTKVAIAEREWDQGHCYLRKKLTNEILDITEDQYTKREIAIPYYKGIGGSFWAKDNGFTKDGRKLAEMAGLIESN